MSNDIVTRLRDLREVLMGNPIMAREVQEAMDEIERLRAELQHSALQTNVMRNIATGPYGDASEQIVDLVEELAECQRQYQKEKQARNRWTQCAERLVEWENGYGYMEALDFYRNNQRLDREDLK